MVRFTHKLYKLTLAVAFLQSQRSDAIPQTRSRSSATSFLSSGKRSRGVSKLRGLSYTVQDKVNSFKQNSGFFEELRAPNYQRECVDEQCTKEELREIFPDDRDKVTQLRRQLHKPCYLNPCDPLGTETCEQTWNRRKCKCKEGWKGDDCSEDIDECWIHRRVIKRPACPNNQGCINQYNGYTCICLHGYEKTNNTCVDIDECATGQPCEAGEICRNFHGAYDCECASGYKRVYSKISSNWSCEDINECDDADVCNSGEVCVNTDGNYICDANPCRGYTCPDGFVCDKTQWNEAYCSCNRPGFYPDPLAGETLGSCLDKNECETDAHGCGEHERCVNKNLDEDSKMYECTPM